MKINKQIPGTNSLSNVLRSVIFLIFYILSIRSVLVYLNYLSVPVQLIGIVAVFTGIALCWWKIIWVLYLFIACIPLISGIQELGFMKSIPLVSFLFSIIYIAWFSKFFFWRRKSLFSENIISNLIDILSGVIYLSIIACLCIYPLEYSFYRLQYASIMGQFDPFWFMEAGYIVLQGMFFYRIFELELKDEKDKGFIIPCLYFHAITVLLFAFQEIIVRLVDKKEIGIIFSPFQDPHSYGGYILVLFFFFAYILFKEKKNTKIVIFLALSLLLCIFLSGSFTTVLCVVFVGAILGVIVLEKRKKIIFLTSFVIGIMIVLYSAIEFAPENRLTIKYSNRFNYSEVLKLNTITERFELWDQALGIIKEFPLTGSGVGSFLKISNYYSKDKANSGEFRNAHNYYFQFAAELGVPALSLFLLILFFTYKAGFQATNSLHSKGLLFGLSAYLLTMLTGHHLLLSTQQFFFWFILFAIVFPINTDFKKRSLNFETKYLSKILCILIFMVIAGHAINSFYFKKEVKGLYDFGLYKPQTVNRDKMSWINKHSRQKFHAQTDYFGFSIYAEPENVSSGLLEIKLYVNDKLIDGIIWKKKGLKHRYYHIPGIKGRSLKISTSASDSYNPYKRGLSKSIRENRDQSAAITDITFFRIPIIEGTKECTL